MKKLTLFNIINSILAVAYITLLIVQRYKPFAGMPLADYWFPTLCMALGLSLVCKAIIFKSDSATWFGTYLILNGATLFASFYMPLNYTTLWPTLVSSAALSSLIVGVFFRDWLHYKIAAFLAIIFVSFYLYAFKVLALGWFLLTFFGTVVFAVFVGSLIPERFYLNKKEK